MIKCKEESISKKSIEEDRKNEKKITFEIKKIIIELRASYI